MELYVIQNYVYKQVNHVRIYRSDISLYRVRVHKRILDLL